MHLPHHSAFLLRLHLSVENQELIPLLKESEMSGSKMVVIREENVGMKAYLAIVQCHGKKGFSLICATKSCHFISVVLCNIRLLLHIVTSHVRESTAIAFCSL